MGRICAVCDVFDALLSPRPYKEPWPVQEALDELRRERGKHFDPAVVDAFMTLVDDLDPLLFDEPPRARNLRLARYEMRCAPPCSPGTLLASIALVVSSSACS